jgi:hypothetical protein
MIERDKAFGNEQETYAPRRTPFSRISKSNLFYIMIIAYLGITMAFVLSIKFTPEERFTEYLGNAATSISIVLALIAIFYSFISGESLSQSIGHINEASNSVSKSRDSISEFLREIRAITQTSEISADNLRKAHEESMHSQNKMKLAVVKFESKFDEWENVITQLPNRLDTLKEIEKRLQAVEYPARFENWDQAKSSIEAHIIESFEQSKLKGERTTIDCLGVALHVSWRKLKDCITRYYDDNKEYPKALIRLKALSRDWKGWLEDDDEWSSDDHNKWKDHNHEFWTEVENFVAKVKNNKFLRIQIVSYDYDPNLHGILINGRHLYRSSCNFRKAELKQNKELIVHESPYFYFLSESSKFSDSQISDFMYWLDYKNEVRLDSAS